MVLQCRFYFYSGLVKPADQETAAIEKRVWDSWLPRRGVHMGAPGSVHLEAEGVRGEQEQKPVLWFSGKEGMGKAGRAGLGLARGDLSVDFGV